MSRFDLYLRMDQRTITFVLLRVERGYGLKTIGPDGGCTNIWDDVTPSMRPSMRRGFLQSVGSMFLNGCA